jgi:type IV fimbrial biogenesis protein FimT
MRSRGFTIIEFAITLAIVGILVAIALPSFMGMLANSQVRAVSSQLNAALGTARAEALRTRTAVTICAKSTADQCKASSAAAANAWNDGWLVFVDTNGNGTVDSGERILNETSAVAAGIEVSGAAQYIFRSSGTANAQGTIQVRKSGATSGRDLGITSGGRVMTKAVDTP